MSIAGAIAQRIDPCATFTAAFGVAPLAWQVRYLHERRPTCVLKGRQVGASSAAAALAIWHVLYRSAIDVVCVSPSLKQSGEILSKARIGLRNIGTSLDQDSAQLLRLSNGSRLVSLPGTERSVRGYSATLLVLDEGAYVEEATVTAARALVAATNGRIVFQSTPAGPSGSFHAAATGVDDEWARLVVPSSSVSTIDPGWLEAQRRQMSPDDYQKEFECEFGRAGTALFTMEKIEALFLDA